METGTYVIGINDSLQALIAPAFLASLRQVAPRARVRMQPVPQQGGISAMTSRAIDLMVAFYPVDMESLRSELLLTTLRLPVGQIQPTYRRDHLGARTGIARLPRHLAVRPDYAAARPLLPVAWPASADRRHTDQLPGRGRRDSRHRDLRDDSGLPRQAAVPASGMRFSPMEDEGMAVPIHLCWHNNVHSHPFVTVLRSLLASAARHVAA
jgi:hypothetical protein